MLNLNLNDTGFTSHTGRVPIRYGWPCLPKPLILASTPEPRFRRSDTNPEPGVVPGVTTPVPGFIPDVSTSEPRFIPSVSIFKQCLSHHQVLSPSLSLQHSIKSKRQSLKYVLLFIQFFSPLTD